MRHRGDRSGRLFGVLPAVVGLLVLFAWAAVPAAHAVVASVWREGVAGRPFTVDWGNAEDVESGVDVHGATDQSVDLQPIVSWTLDAASPIYAGFDPDAIDPRCIQPLDGGRRLIVSGGDKKDDSGPFIAVVRQDGKLEWSYEQSDDPQLKRPFCAQRFVRDEHQYVLVADRSAKRVFAVTLDADKRVVWQYGVVSEPGLEVDHLTDPLWATYNADDDTVLIADNLGGNRVIEVRWGDYSAEASLHGFTADSIVWQYGTPGKGRVDGGLLDKPRSPQRLPGAARHTLITDADAHVVFEVDREGRIVWQFGEVGSAGRPENGRLQDPSCAERLGDGATLIADTNNGLVVRVHPDGGVTTYDTAKLDRPAWAGDTTPPAPRVATLAEDGAILVADNGYRRFVEIGLPAEASFTSQPLDMGSPEVAKRFLSLAWTGEAPSGTKVCLSYSIGARDWTHWRALAAGADLVLPAKAVGKVFRYRIRLVSAERTTSPRLDSLAIRWLKVARASVKENDKPATGSGVAYMGGAGGSAGQAGAVTFAGSGTGTGTGSGSGSGSGTGVGTPASAGADTAGAVARSTPPTVAQATADGATAAVTGTKVQLATGDGGGGGGEGATGAESQAGRRTFWAALATAILVACVVPPLLGRRLQDELTVTGDVPATATRDARLLRGAG
jgi:hypothetical protein